ATKDANADALTVATAERDCATLQAAQALGYVNFLEGMTLSSEGLEQLLALARQVTEVYIYHANRMAWLAQRALEHETRQVYDFINTSYSSGNELTDMTRAQQLTADLEAMRS